MKYRLHPFLLATTALVRFGLGSAVANPLGAQVVGGVAAVKGQGTPSVTVKQGSDRAIINWQQFNIGSGETTRFVQPDASSVILNRVTGVAAPSVINGSITSNGKVFLVNPDGMLFGAGAVINTGGFLATTHNIKNSDFLAGRHQFNQPGSADASIVNLGTITASNGGFAALVAPGVRNAGTISANLGTVGLAAGNGFTLDFYGDKLITLNVNDSIAASVRDVATGKSLDTLVKNEGRLKAHGGRVELTAVAARRVVDSVINNTGVIEANSVGMRKGMIVLGAATEATKPVGAPRQVVKISGTLSASGKKKGTVGGKIQVTGEDIQVARARINASGQSGGGTILIGGDWAGGKPASKLVSHPKAVLEAAAIPAASIVTIDMASILDASALGMGDGGKIIAWSDHNTSFEGKILARGGSISGDGGFVETSGHDNLRFTGSVDVGVVNGKNGLLLLDPKDVTIGTSGIWVVTPTSIQTALASGDVTVTTNLSGPDNGDLTVAQSVRWNGNSTLNLVANRNVSVSDGVSIANNGGGSLNLRADSTGNGTGAVTFAGSGKVDFSQSTGAVSIYYDPTGFNKYQNRISYGSAVTTNPSVSGQFNSYTLVNDIVDLQNISQNLAGKYALGKDVDGRQM